VWTFYSYIGSVIINFPLPSQKKRRPWHANDARFWISL
jgi:hypothetical protein